MSGSASEGRLRRACRTKLPDGPLVACSTPYQAIGLVKFSPWGSSTLIEGSEFSPPIFPSFTIAWWVSSHHCLGPIPELCYRSGGHL